MNMLRATWSIRDETGELVAHGTQGLDDLVGVASGVDPYEASLRIAQSIELALLAFLPGYGCVDLIDDSRQLPLFPEGR